MTQQFCVKQDSLYFVVAARVHDILLLKNWKKINFLRTFSKIVR
jgi:hypothetical protein